MTSTRIRSTEQRQAIRWMRSIERSQTLSGSDWKISDADLHSLVDLARGSDELVADRAADLTYGALEALIGAKTKAQIARLTNAGMPLSEARESVQLAGQEGFAQALSNWDPARGNAFSKHAQTLATFAMQKVDSGRAGTLTRGDAKAVSVARKAHEIFVVENGTTPTEEELQAATAALRKVTETAAVARSLGLPIDDPAVISAAQKKIDKQGGKTISKGLLGALALADEALRIDAPVSDDGSAHDTLAAPTTDTSQWEGVLSEDMKDRITDLLPPTKGGRPHSKDALQRAIRDPLIQSAAFSFDRSKIVTI